ncbi:hypothetical protein ACQEVI_03610 [Promicromonospora sp. CA-289599]|uniref:hypothetical protein n=1 Tax=Promicromonospora sp. CA-289599 TaxID=3240014 RepID=UPI003D916738
MTKNESENEHDDAVPVPRANPGPSTGATPDDAPSPERANPGPRSVPDQAADEDDDGGDERADERRGDSRRTS